MRSILSLSEVPAAEVDIGVCWIVGKRTAFATLVALSTPTSWYGLPKERRISHFYTAECLSVVRIRLGQSEFWRWSVDCIEFTNRN